MSLIPYVLWHHLSSSSSSSSSEWCVQKADFLQPHNSCLVYIIRYEGESVNRSQMDIKRKTCDTGTWKKHSFPDMSYTSTDIVPSLYQRVESRSIEVFLTVVSVTSALPFQRLRHQRNLFPSCSQFLEKRTHIRTLLLFSKTLSVLKMSAIT
jgi:hypothetical protein